MTCLLCQAPFTSRQSLIDIFLLRSDQVFCCSSCWAKFERLGDLHCPTCYKGQEQSTASCQDCNYWLSRHQEVNHQALYRYNQAMRDYFSSYKFQGDYLLHRLFTKEMKKALKAYSSYTLVPIPLSPTNLKERGFNQVTAFLDAAKLPYQDLLEKQETIKQSSKSRQERLETKQVFSLRKNQVLPNNILLVDDIYTSGATIQLARNLLHENGVKTIKSFSLAR